MVLRRIEDRIFLRRGVLPLAATIKIIAIKIRFSFITTKINFKNLIKINVIKKLNFGKANLVVAIPDPWIDVQTIADLEEIAFEFRDKKKKRLVNSDMHDTENSDVLVSAVISPYLLTHLFFFLSIIDLLGESIFLEFFMGQ